MNHYSFLILSCLLVNGLANPLLLAPNNKISGRIIGGSSAPEGRFPYQVSLQMHLSHFCGGSIIGSQWIMTAAHCLLGASAAEMIVVVGTTNLNVEGTQYLAQRLIVHPNFDLNYLTGDIGLVQVRGQITFTSKVSSIGLPTYDISKADQSVIVSGWGKTSNNGGLPTQLQYLNSRIYDHTSCLQFSKYVTDQNICTFTRKGQGLCNGDSGSPVVTGNVQVGIVSWGNPCALGSPDVHTKVFSYLSWIKNYVN